MELAQDQKPINHNTTHLASKQEQDQDLTPTISDKNRNQSLSSCSCSSSSLSSLASIEDGFKPEKLDQDRHWDNEHLSSSDRKPTTTEQLPPLQVMERSNENANPNTKPYKIPSHVFARTTSTAPGDQWSTLSNESLFSIHMGNMSFVGDYSKSGELAFSQPLSPLPFDNYRGGGGGDVVVSRSDLAAKTMSVDTSKKVDVSDQAFGGDVSKAEQKAAPSIREVIRANEAANNTGRKMDRSISRRSDDFSVKSFAFPILGHVDKSGSLQAGPLGKQRKPSQPETPKISVDAQTDEELKQEEANKSQTPKAEPDRATHRDNRWLSCFPCCAASSV